MEQKVNPTRGNGATENKPHSWNEVLVAEIKRLRPGVFGELRGEPWSKLTCLAERQARKDDLRDIYGKIGSRLPVPRRHQQDAESSHATPPAGDSEPKEATRPPQDTPTAQAPGGAPSSQPLAALCLSGGGIRSATFNLGVLQCLAKVGLLDRFDYLSSVSGGGYIASWLRAWIHRSSLGDVLKDLGPPNKHEKDGKEEKVDRDPLQPEPPQVSDLREYSNYLTPQLGLFSGDTWAAAALVSRNLLLNWLVSVPVIAAVIGLPLLFQLIVRTTEFLHGFHMALLYWAIGIEMVASLCIYGFRRFAKGYPTAQVWFIVFCVVPILLAAMMLSTAALGLGLVWRADIPHPCCSDYAKLWEFSVWWCIGAPVIGWVLAEILAFLLPGWTEPRRSKERSARPQAEVGAMKATIAMGERQPQKPRGRVAPCLPELFALIVSGTIGAVMLVKVTSYWFPFLYQHPTLYVVLVLPILLGIYLVSRVLFVGLSTLTEVTARRRKLSHKRTYSDVIFGEDADREWWGRLSGWVLLILVGWLAVTAICLLGSDFPYFLGQWIAKSDPNTPPTPVGAVKWVVGALGAVSGVTAALTGSSSKTAAQSGAPGQTSTAAKLIVSIAGPLFVVCIIILLSWGMKELGDWFTDRPTLFDYPADWVRGTSALEIWMWGKFPLLLLLLVLLSGIAGFFVNVNRFSLHGMYRNRLVRAYLGASNSVDRCGTERVPDPFTGFAMTDNLALHTLFEDCNGRPIADVRPFPIINTTLNLVHGEKLAWQERKAESFSMTPLYCGAWTEGYRDSQEYGGPGGITLGTAMTISGAAANPNMGYASSPALSFLMTLFNVRLGAWLGNTNHNGQKTYRNHGPMQALKPLFSEMFGLTTNSRSYVNLSDGGHFENLGLYEVVLRRCRYVLVSDAGMDRGFAFEDLGNAIRKIRIDFGIEIAFTQKINILPNGPGKKPGLYCAIAKIGYSKIDDAPVEDDGTLIYIKPSLRGHEEHDVLPYDVYSYSRSSKDFPHESTADQWFSESQFESYRALGYYILSQASGGMPPPGGSDRFEAFLKSVEVYVDSLKKKSAGSGLKDPEDPGGAKGPNGGQP